MRKLNVFIKVVFVALFIYGCQSEDIGTEMPNAAIDEGKSLSLDKKKVAFDLITLLNNAQFNANIIATLENDMSPGIKLATLLEQNAFAADHESYKSLINVLPKADYLTKSKELPDNIEIPELWLQKPSNKKADYSNLLVSFAPEGDEKDWKEIIAYTLDKQVVRLSVDNIPDVPVLVIETKGFEVLKAEVEYMNQKLQTSGLQNDRFEASKMDLSPTSKANGGLETTKLDKIRLKDDKEAWVSGAAEIYAITSGIRNAGNDPEIKIIPMYYLDWGGTTYYPNQIMLFWDDYKYQAANIQFFEKDDNVNYKEFVSTIIKGVFDIIGSVYAQPWVSVLGRVAGAIIEAMPDQWYTNNDDYVDSLYTIEKFKSYHDHFGAAANAQVTLTPLFIPGN